METATRTPELLRLLGAASIGGADFTPAEAKVELSLAGDVSKCMWNPPYRGKWLSPIPVIFGASTIVLALLIAFI